MTIYKSALVTIFVISASQNCIADIYKCKKPDGSIVFQDKHCAEKANEKIFAKPQPKLCYSITNSAGRTVEVQNFWTEKQKNDALFYVQIDNKKTAFLPEQIQSMQIVEQKEPCSLAKLVNKARESFDATICDGVYYLTNKDEYYLALAELNSINACESKSYADGFWTLDQKKHLIQSAYISYAKQSNQLKVLLFPFLLSKDEEETMLEQRDINSILSKKSDSYAFGIVLKLKEGVTEPQINDVIQFQSILMDSKTSRVRNYDQRWQMALSIKKLEISKSEQGSSANISLTLNDRDQQAEINVSAQMMEEN